MLIRDRIVELRRVRARELRPNPKNWRRHPQQQHDALRGVLAEIGFAGAGLARQLDDGTLELIDGHLRAELDGELEVPVLILDVTAEEADKLLATYDVLGEMAEADPDALKSLLAGTSFRSDAVQAALDDLARRYQLANLGEAVQDEVPAPPDAAKTQPGDLWLLGHHRLLCGDSSQPHELDRLLDGAPVHLVNTDPPYNVKLEPRSNNAIAAGLSSFPGATHHQGLDVARHPEKAKPTGKKLRPKDRPLANDFVSDEAFDRLLAAWFGNIARVLQPGRGFYVWGGYANCANYPPALKAVGLYFSQAIIWVKEHPVLTRKDFMGNHEWCFYGWRLPLDFASVHQWCFYGWREGQAHVYLGPANATDVWSIKKVSSQSMVHLTEKPVELAVRAIEYSSRPGEHVLDLFGGSGSTLIAAEQTGRRAFLMELDTLYCDVIVERWEKLTGKQAVLCRAGEPVTRPAAAQAAAAPAKKQRARDLTSRARHGS